MRKPQLNSKRQALLAERAHAMRHAPTASEAALWRLISARKLGVSFRRQVPLAGRYIADFLAPSAHLVLEVDGDSHCGRTGPVARRDRALARLGYRPGAGELGASVGSGRLFGGIAPPWPSARLGPGIADNAQSGGAQLE